MKEKLAMKNDVNLRKTVVILIGLLTLFLVIGSSIAIADTLLSEQNESLDVQKSVLNPTASSPRPETAPLNPDFIRYQKNRNLFSRIGGQKIGAIPPSVDLRHLQPVSVSQVSAPAYYDLRTLNKVTPVKDQLEAGSCWAHASYASLESCLMPGETWDFSENNLKNLLSSSYPQGFDRNANLDGGTEFMSTAYLARWSGPVKESDDPYNDSSSYSPTGLPVQKHVKDVLFLSKRRGPLDNQEIKWALQNYGAVYTTYYHDLGSTYYSTGNYSYYYDGSHVLNHAVAIVGWDDNFNKNKFSMVPPGNGAFIIKNSWGTGWGNKGYFYISYYDNTLGYHDNAVFTAGSSNDYQNNYQYDPLGWCDSMGFSAFTAWGANIFTAKSKEVLKAVSFYATDSNCSYQIYIYTNPSSGPISQAGPILTQSGTSSTAGYHTVNLNSGVKLNAGQKFSVVIKFTTPGYSYPVAIERPLSYSFSTKVKANASESFISHSGSTWDDVTAYFSNTNICIKAFTDTTGNVPPVANFSTTPTSGNVPLNVAFIDTSTGSPTSWYWNFGDRNTSTAQNPVHTYSAAGNYTVTLTATNTEGSNTVTKSNYITVIKPQSLPVASFTSNIYSGYMPLTVAFTDTSTGAPTSWEWSFGDGTNSTAENPVHVYNKAGKYTVTLVAKNKAGSSTAKKTDYINVINKVVPPVAAFTASPVSGTALLKVTFTDSSRGSPTSWSWNFGDKTTSTARNPVHTYSKAGKYTVSLKVKNAAGTNMVTKSGYIAVNVLKAPIAAFTASSTSGKAPLKVQFTDKSVNVPTSWKWSFGDGTYSTQKSPAHTYSKAGKYTVFLIVKNAKGSNTKIMSGYITVK